MYVTWEEAFGRVIIEAMSKGTPIIGSTRGSLSELIPDSCGILSTDFHTINANLKKVKNLDRKKVFEHAKNFEIKHEVKNILDISIKLLQKNGFIPY